MVLIPDHFICTAKCLVMIKKKKKKVSDDNFSKGNHIIVFLLDLAQYPDSGITNALPNITH